MSEKHDGYLIESLITDDRVIELIRAHNAASLGALVCHDGRVPEGARLEYDPNLDLEAASLRNRALYLTMSYTPAGNGIMDGLWADEMLRQVRIGELVGCLDRQQISGAVYATGVQECFGELYGRPDPSAFAAAVAEVRANAARYVEHDNEIVRGLALWVTEVLPELGDAATESLPSAETVATVRTWLTPLTEPLFAAVDELELGKADKANATQIADLFGRLLEPVGLKAEVTDQVTSMTFQPSRGRMAIPPTRQMTPGILKKELVHEMTHVLRYCNAGLGMLALAQFGLPGYLPFEEGVATVLAEVATSKSDQIDSFARPEAYLAIGLASGLLEDQVWTPDQLFQLLWRHYALPRAVKAAKAGPIDLEKIEQDGMSQAWTRLVRTYRGGRELGSVVCPRDLSYRDGNAAVWRWIAKTVVTKPENLGLLLAAKADLNNELHLAYIHLCASALTFGV